MWNSNGDLNGAELQFVDPGPIHVSGKIDGKSSVIIVSMQDITVDGRIDGTYAVSCYRDALKSLPADVRVYSSASDDISQALSRRIQSAGTRSPTRALSR